MICRGQKKCKRQNASLPSAEKRHSAKTHFAECQKMALGKIHRYRVLEKRHLPSAEKWHSAKYI